MSDESIIYVEEKLEKYVLQNQQLSLVVPHGDPLERFFYLPNTTKLIRIILKHDEYSYITESHNESFQYGFSIGMNIKNWPVSGAYQPDAIACFNSGGKNYFATANEGDLRDSDEARVKDLTLDPSIFCKYTFSLKKKLQNTHIYLRL